jgi:hypothetical protein
MAIYTFIVRKGEMEEHIGGFQLHNDGEALTMADQIYRRLIDQGDAKYTDCVLDVASGGRAVGSLPAVVNRAG